MIGAQHYLLFVVVFAGAECLWPRYKIPWKLYLRNHAHNLTIGVFSLWLVQLFYRWITNEGAPEATDSFALNILHLVLGLMIVDLISWVWHSLNHRFSLLWRSHRVHHSDQHLISSSSVRFHPFEVIPGNGLRLLVAWAFALSPQQLAFIQLVYFGQNVIQHSNLVFPEKLEKIFSSFLVTPRLHHLHHSVTTQDQWTNLGTTFSLWDRLFRTFQWPSDRRIQFGVTKDQETPTLKSILLLPLKK